MKRYVADREKDSRYVVLLKNAALGHENEELRRHLDVERDARLELGRRVNTLERKLEAVEREICVSTEALMSLIDVEASERSRADERTITAWIRRNVRALVAFMRRVFLPAMPLPENLASESPSSDPESAAHPELSPLPLIAASDEGADEEDEARLQTAPASSSVEQPAA